MDAFFLWRPGERGHPPLSWTCPRTDERGAFPGMVSAYGQANDAQSRCWRITRRGPVHAFLVRTLAVASLFRLQIPQMFEHQDCGSVRLGKLDNPATDEVSNLLAQRMNAVPEIPIILLALGTDASLVSVAGDLAQERLPTAVDLCSGSAEPESREACRPLSGWMRQPNDHQDSDRLHRCVLQRSAADRRLYQDFRTVW